MGLGPIDTILSIGEKLIDKLIPDPKQKADAILKLKELEQAGDLQVIAAQTDINKIEASNTNWFISGWRPFVGWVCGVGLLYAFLLSPLFGLRPLDITQLTSILVGMLGLSGLRTYEKFQDVAAK